MSDPAPKKLPRDAYIDEVYAAARRDPSIVFLSADFGAAALDAFRDTLKGQFIHAGISEANMANIASGLALRGKKVTIYAMVPFVTFRCLEQLKVGVATMGTPVTVLGVGSGFSYDDAGPTHYGTDDVSCMRSLVGLEILSPSDTTSTVETARLACTRPAFRYVRLDRKHLPDVYPPGDRRFLEEGVCEVDRGEDLCLFASGYMLARAREAARRLGALGIKAGVADVFRLKPLNGDSLKAVLSRYRKAATIEEHFLEGGMGGAFAEAIADLGLRVPLKRIGIPERYYMDNGGREHLHRLCGLDVESLVRTLSAFASG